ncbi:MAG: hypothetical protein AB1631_26825 [Acidobacteriota bacterium]
MAAFLGFLIMFLLAELLLLAFSIGVSYLLRWAIPSLDQGMAILISLVATIASALAISRLLGAAGNEPVVITEVDDDDDEEDGDDDDDERDLQARRMKGSIYSFDRFPRRKRRKRRR